MGGPKGGNCFRGGGCSDDRAKPHLAVAARGTCRHPVPSTERSGKLDAGRRSGKNGGGLKGTPRATAKTEALSAKKSFKTATLAKPHKIREVIQPQNLLI